MLLFAFWSFDKHPPRYCTRIKPDSLQFDSQETFVSPSVNTKKRKPSLDTDELTSVFSSYLKKMDEPSKKDDELKKESLDIERKKNELGNKIFERDSNKLIYDQLNDFINKGIEASGMTVQEFEALKRRRNDILLAL